MHQNTEIEPGFFWQKLTSQIKRDTINISMRNLSEPDIRIVHQCKGCKKLFAELAISNPWILWFIPFERQRINKKGSSIKELNIIGTRIFQRHIILH